MISYIYDQLSIIVIISNCNLFSGNKFSGEYRNIRGSCFIMLGSFFKAFSRRRFLLCGLSGSSHMVGLQQRIAQRLCDSLQGRYVYRDPTYHHFIIVSKSVATGICTYQQYMVTLFCSLGCLHYKLQRPPWYWVQRWFWLVNLWIRFEAILALLYFSPAITVSCKEAGKLFLWLQNLIICAYEGLNYNWERNNKGFLKQQSIGVLFIQADQLLKSFLNAFYYYWQKSKDILYCVEDRHLHAFLYSSIHHSFVCWF